MLIVISFVLISYNATKYNFSAIYFHNKIQKIRYISLNRTIYYTYELSLDKMLVTLSCNLSFLSHIVYNYTSMKWGFDLSITQYIRIMLYYVTNALKIMWIFYNFFFPKVYIKLNLKILKKKEIKYFSIGVFYKMGNIVI